MRPLAALVAVLALASCAPSDDGGSATGAVVPDAPHPSLSASVEPMRISQGQFRFAVIGDLGTGTSEQRAVAERMCRWQDRRTFELVFTTGDNVYPDGDPDDFQEKFVEPYECLNAKWHASLGNHDAMTDAGRKQIADPAFGMRRRNYIVREGGVRFVVADSNRLNMRFLRRKTRPEEGDRWTVLLFHHPVFSGGNGHGPTPGFAELFGELLAKRGVDLVLTGHDHIYSVTEPVAGVRYVVTGGGGAPLYGCRSSVAVTRCVSRHHFLYVSVTKDKMTVYAVPPKGRPFDSFSITRG